MSSFRHCFALFLLLMLIAMAGCSSSSTPPISVSLSPSSAQGIDQNQTLSITATVINDTSARGVSWALTGPGSLSTSTSSSVTYNSPTTNVTSAQQVTLTATSLADPAKSALLQITLNPLPQIPFQALANGSVGVSYSQMITLTGGTLPFQWSVYDGPIITGYEVGGSVPDGLTLNATTGAISGTPTVGGTWYFEVTATDAAGMVAINGLMSIEISPSATAANPVPFLNQTLAPTSIAPGSSSFTLSVSGTGFVSGATIGLDGTALTTTFLDNEHLTATVPATNVANASTAAVTVLNPAPGGGASNVVYFPIAVSASTVSFAVANSPLKRGSA